MSLHNLAKHIAAQGRGEDSVLIHMTPREVAGLQRLALASGGSLTINPSTGLPEAGFLSSILPMIAGAAATLLTGGAAAPVASALAGAGAGAVTKGATSGDWSMGSLLGGALSGFGGAGIGSALGTAGGAVPGALGAAPTGAAEVAAASVPSMTAGQLGIDAIGQQAAAAGLTSGASAAGTAGALLPATSVGIGAGPTAAVPQSFGAMAQGAKNVFTGNMAGFKEFAGNVGKYPAMAGALGTAMNMQPEVDAYGPPERGPMKYKRTTYRPGEVNISDPTQPYFVGQGFGPYEEVTMAQGGAVPGYADGGTPARSGPLADYIAGLNRKLTSPISWSQQRQNVPATGASQQGPSVPAAGTGIMAGLPADWRNALNTMAGINQFAGTGLGVGSGTAQYRYDPATGRFVTGTGASTTPTAPTTPSLPPQPTTPAYVPPDTVPATTPSAVDLVGTFDPYYDNLGGSTGPFVDAVSAVAPPTTAASIDQQGYMPFNPPPVYTPPTSTYTAPTSYADLTSDYGDMFAFAKGGGIASLGVPSIGGYSDGGRLLRGPGDGVSDDIPASIHRDDGSQQEARLADGEFVIDAQTVSRLGNGSTEAGARKLYAMMDRIHAIKTRPGKNLKADRYLPA